jgi:hypothetical protein
MGQVRVKARAVVVVAAVVTVATTVVNKIAISIWSALSLSTVCRRL